MRGAVQLGAVSTGAVSRLAVAATWLAGVAAWLAAVACGHRAPLTSCDDDLRGVYITGAERWMVLDHGAALEAYPLFPDGSGPADIVAAPRWIALDRAPDAARTGSAPGTEQPGGPSGLVHRRYMRREASCEATAPVRLARCAGDTLELALADPAAPLGFAPCVSDAPAGSRTVRWRRE